MMALPLWLKMIKNVKDIVVFIGLKVLNSDNSYKLFSRRKKMCASHFCKETTIENNQFLNIYHIEI